MRCQREGALLLGLILSAAVAAAQGTGSSTAGNVRDLRSFGAVGDGKADDTAALARAIDETSQAQGTLIVPAGTYRIGTVRLRSHLTLQLQQGAVLLGTTDLSRYAPIGSYGLAHDYAVNSSGEGERVGMLVAQDAEDIRITGDGAIDGNGMAFFDPQTPHASLDYDPAKTRNPAANAADLHRVDDGPVEMLPAGRPGTLVQFHHVRRITIEGVTLRHSPNWTLHLQHATDVTVHAIHIANDLKIPNNDGIDCMDCHDVRISDSSISAGDDDFAIVGSENVVATNCVLQSNSAAIRLEDSRDSIFSNLVMNTNRGIGIFARTGTHTRNILFSNILIQAHMLHGHWWGKAEPIYLASSAQRGDVSVENVQFVNISANAQAGALLFAAAPGTVRDISFHQMSITLEPPSPELAESEGGNFDLRWTARSRAEAIVSHDTPGLFAGNIDSLDLRGFKLRWKATGSEAGMRWPEYFSNAVQIEGFQRVVLADLEVEPRPESRLPAIVLSNGLAAETRDLHSPTAGTRLLETHAVRTLNGRPTARK